MDVINKVYEFLNNLPPIFYDSTIKKEQSESIDDIRNIVRHEIKDYNLDKTEKEIKSLKKELLMVHK
tara:strand:+ start:221 stop:421 length:201 start_codon:yes stop_codon:yes gene_type:complete